MPFSLLHLKMNGICDDDTKLACFVIGFYALFYNYFISQQT